MAEFKCICYKLVRQFSARIEHKTYTLRKTTVMSRARVVGRPDEIDCDDKTNQGLEHERNGGKGGPETIYIIGHRHENILFARNSVMINTGKNLCVNRTNNIYERDRILN